MMGGLEPCDEAAIATVTEFPEANKSMHLMLIAANVFHKRPNASDVGIRRCFQKVRTVAQAPEHSVKQAKPVRRAMKDCDLRKFDEGGRNVECCACLDVRERRVA